MNEPPRLAIRRSFGFSVVSAAFGVVFTCGLTGGCDRTTEDPPPNPPVIDAGFDAYASKDASKRRDASTSKCAPGILTPDDVPVGYLAPQKAVLRRTVDGDTAHFDLPGKPDQDCRFLFVNTEESHGDATTEFGVRTAGIVEGYLKAAKDIVVVIREKVGSPGQPDLDPFKRNLALVFVDGDLFQTRLVREGLSAYYSDYGCAPGALHITLLGAEMLARDEALGIWTSGHPTDYELVFDKWIHSDKCRPNPYKGEAYCPADSK